MTNVRWFNWLLLSAVGIVVAIPIWFVVQQSMYGRLSSEIRDSLKSLEFRRPPTVNADAWECCVNWAVTAQCNICFSPGHTKYSAMLALRGQIDAMLERN